MVFSDRAPRHTEKGSVMSVSIAFRLNGLFGHGGDDVHAVLKAQRGLNSLSAQWSFRTMKWKTL